ncbi:uncharacterized protein LOC104899165 [Beta vulgaris subsp. vulgaris]|uniref:uncharacterized protein LOC104899165 n=1 Tax=Beta vulgaris subsp. vulgaris TaxID=3555 RepID=UPI00053F72E3|nr:uncharacterized protein LOC104899165 [Beta vulgaris subsp. vulgaris]
MTENSLKQMNVYSVSYVYTLLVGDHTRVHWDKYVWNRLSIPKHRFVIWLAMKRRLQTTEHLHRIGVSNTSNCLICGNGVEDHVHLFFSCYYSEKILKKVKDWMGIKTQKQELMELIRWLSRSNHSKFQKQVLAAVWAAMVYYIWGARNDAYWNSQVVNIDTIVHRIQKMVIERVYSVLPKKLSRKDREWMRSRALLVCN